MTEQELQRLARHRAVPGYKFMPMTKEQIMQRRAYMRQMLKNSRFAFEDNKSLDNMRLEYIRGYGHIVEDINNYDFMLFDASFNYGEFRKSLAMIPFEYMDKTAKDFDFSCYKQDVADLRKIVNDFILHFDEFKNSGYGIYIQSREKGTGKTLLACILLNEISVRYDVGVKFVTIYDYLEMTKKSYDGDTAELKTIIDTPVLVIDDLGVNMRRDWIENTLFTLIDKRYTGNKITIYTSNIPLAELDIDRRIVSRIESRSFVAKIPDVPVRKNIAEDKKADFLKKIEIPAASGQASGQQEKHTQ